MVSIGDAHDNQDFLLNPSVAVFPAFREGQNLMSVVGVWIPKTEAEDHETSDYILCSPFNYLYGSKTRRLRRPIT